MSHLKEINWGGIKNYIGRDIYIFYEGGYQRVLVNTFKENILGIKFKRREIYYSLPTYDKTKIKIYIDAD